jgi:riboflavin kinase / FMN adenylyltransferase
MSSRTVSGLTIGNFDGVHLGHLALLKELRARLPNDGKLLVYTFSNHPSHLLSHLTPIPYISTLEHKLKLLKEAGVDNTYVTLFTAQLAKTPFDQFLITLKEKLDFSILGLGEDARFGKNREADPVKVCSLGKQLGFEVIYIPKFKMEDKTVSSGFIRTLIAEGDFSKASHYLGRPYSIYAPLTHGSMSLKELCLPPSRIYKANLDIQGKIYAVDAQIVGSEAKIIGLPPLSAPFAEIIFL